MTMGRLATMSLEGLKHVQALERHSVTETAGRLYAWNRLPASTWRRLNAEPQLLGARARSAAGGHWELVSPGPPETPWCRWRLHARLGAAIGSCWKVYISPHPRHLAEAISAAMFACADLPVLGLKYGADAYGMLRPDKLVVHLATRSAVDQLADRLLRVLDGCPAHGVPYSAELGGDGLISWGRDPPTTPGAMNSPRSWRAWVTQILAEGLLEESPSDIEPWERAITRIASAGVDPVTWEPMPALWTSTEPAQLEAAQ